MANTYTQIYLQIVFSVKGRQNLIHKNWKDELHKYICGVVNGKDQKVYAIGGVADHIHILVSIKPTILISDLVRDIKANSSKWINDNHYIIGKFQWQDGGQYHRLFQLIGRNPSASAYHDFVWGGNVV
jgi:putative transposase